MGPRLPPCPPPQRSLPICNRVRAWLAVHAGQGTLYPLVVIIIVPSLSGPKMTYQCLTLIFGDLLTDAWPAIHSADAHARRAPCCSAFRELDPDFTIGLSLVFLSADWYLAQASLLSDPPARPPSLRC